MTDPAEPNPARTAECLVRTEEGLVRGQWRGASARFLGIPFAQAPVGALRFQAPRPTPAWQGILDATAFGATAQRAQLAEVTTIPEPSIAGDSVLNVNVYTPDPRPLTEGLPVLVWIHGGGYTAGSPASPWYDGATFNRDGVVTVVISYRLGFDGFGWIEDAPNNRGVLDWLCALEWVQRNIAAFGGNPGRVTIAGQSAGGGAVLTLAAMPAAQGLFRNVFSMSGAPADLSVERARAIAAEIGERLGVEPSLAGFASASPDAVYAEQGALMRAASSAQERLESLLILADGGLRFGPVVDGELIPASVAESFAAGVGAGLRIALGATRDEFTGALMPSQHELDALDPVSVLERLDLDEAAARAYAELHRGLATTTMAGRLLSDRLFRVGVVDVVAARGGVHTWAYDFAFVSPLSGLSTHCLDLPFFFDLLADPGAVRVLGDSAPQPLADEMHAALVRFIRTGDPGWPPASGTAAMTFDARSGAAADAYASAALARAAGAARV